MLPVTRANLDHICCICLFDIRPSMFNQKVYVVKEEKILLKLLKLTAHITVLKSPGNRKYINDYCRKICEVCFLKTQYSFEFREKIVASAISVNEILESKDLNEKDIENLQYFCRICLNRQSTTPLNEQSLQMEHLKWLKDCSGIRFTSLIDTEKFRIEEGTNITEIAVINDMHFPKQLCKKCLKKLQNVEEFRKLATQSFEYMVSIMDDAGGPEHDLLNNEIQDCKEEVTWNKETRFLENKNNTEENFAYFEIQENESNLEETIDIKNEINFKIINANDKQKDTKKLNLKIGYNGEIEPIVDTTNNSTLKLSDDIKNETDSDIEDGANHLDDDSDLDSPKNETCFFDQNSSDISEKITCSRNTRKRKLKQCLKNSEHELSNQETNLETENIQSTKPKRKGEVEKLEEYEKLSHKRQKLPRKSKESNENDGSSNNNSIQAKDMANLPKCEECSKVYARIGSLRKHQRKFHPHIFKTESNQSTSSTCLICSKVFKRRYHLEDHMRTVHEKLKPYKCSYCSKMFAASSYRQVHELTHTGEFPFVCDWCKKGFAKAHLLKIHIEIHTTQRELLCPICKRAQMSTKALEDHMKTHEKKCLLCPTCGKQFNGISQLEVHQNAVHLKLRPFKCSFCELTFGRKGTLRAHEKMHTEDRPLICSVCKWGFNSHLTLKKHVNKYGHYTEGFTDEKKKSMKQSNDKV